MFHWPDVSGAVGLISCDWFALSCTLGRSRDDTPLIAPAGWSCILASPTAVWGERWFVMDSDGNKVATILCCPRSHIIDGRRAVVEIANRWLYYDDFHNVVERVASIWPMSFDGLNRVDLCCDFEMTPELWVTYSRLADGSAYVKALRSGSVWWQHIQDPFASVSPSSCRIPHCLTFGGHDSTFKWKIYYKWLELQQALPDAKKPYIVEAWRGVGFNPRAVWRIEVSISSSNSVSRLDGRRVLPMQWWDERVELFCNLYADKFIVRAAEGHVDKRNDSRLPFLEVAGRRALRHALPTFSRFDSDPERRFVCKVWHELQQDDVQANRVLRGILLASLADLVERPANVYALQDMYGIGYEDITRMLQMAANSEC